MPESSTFDLSIFGGSLQCDRDFDEDHAKPNRAIRYQV